MKTRREILAGVAATTLIGCAKPVDWCDAPLVTDDGPFPYPDDCPVTADDIEGPYYLADAPERADLDLHGDDGTPVTLSGRVFDGDCGTPIAGAIVELWHADPGGKYDDSDEMRYRAMVSTDSDGGYSVATLLPGRYLNGRVLRPRHIHVKVFDATGSERLTTQLYFEGDPYVDCDGFVNTSLVLPFTGSEESAMVCEDVLFVLA
ncbi:MAG: protocatechuate 3,4-dioxygenase beta subunit [Myxococcota bacterium]|jgi:protocatechuate 3,4-dioxygenase beta subunit